MVELGSNTVHYVDVGQGPSLLMLHGNPTSSLVWKRVIDRLSPSFRCIAPDYLGFGRSVAAEDYGFSPQEHAEVVARLVDHLDLRDYTLVMQDWGGPIGIAAAARDPSRVAGLVVANSWAWPLNGVARVEVMSRLMGGPLGRFAIKRFNLFVNATLPMGHRLRRLTATEMDEYRAAFPTPASRVPTAVLPRALIRERAFLARCEASLAQFSDLPARTATSRSVAGSSSTGSTCCRTAARCRSPAPATSSSPTPPTRSLPPSRAGRASRRPAGRPPEAGPRGVAR